MKILPLILYKASLIAIIGIHIYGFGNPVWAIALSLIGLVCLIGATAHIICRRIALFAVMMWFVYLVDIPLEHHLFAMRKTSLFDGYACTGKNPDTGEVCLVFRSGFTDISEHCYIFKRHRLFVSEHLNYVPMKRGIEYRNPPPHLG